MKRIFTFILSAMLVVFFTAAHAQQNVFVWKNDGNMSVKSVADIDSITSFAGSCLFNIRTSAANSVTTNTLEASLKVSFADNVSSLSQTPEVGVCFSSSHATPTYMDERGRLGTSVTNYKFTLYELDPGTTYYYRAYVKLGRDIFYGNVMSVMTLGDKPTNSTYVVINGHKFVDLGLPSGLLWAKTNVGASSSSDDGDYFAWGETEPKTFYSLDTYKWGSDKEHMSKYNGSDCKTVLDNDDDAAIVNWGAPCRMPTSSEFEELYNQCDCSWKSSYNGANGYLITGSNGNAIFISASGLCSFGDFVDHGLSAYYWSRTIGSRGIGYAYYLGFYSSYIYQGNGSRSLCFPVRPVAEK